MLGNTMCGCCGTAVGPWFEFFAVPHAVHLDRLVRISSLAVGGSSTYDSHRIPDEPNRWSRELVGDALGISENPMVFRHSDGHAVNYVRTVSGQRPQWYSYLSEELSPIIGNEETYESKLTVTAPTGYRFFDVKLLLNLDCPRTSKLHLYLQGPLNDAASQGTGGGGGAISSDYGLIVPRYRDVEIGDFVNVVFDSKALDRFIPIKGRELDGYDSSVENRTWQGLDSFAQVIEKEAIGTWKIRITPIKDFVGEEQEPGDFSATLEVTSGFITVTGEFSELNSVADRVWEAEVELESDEHNSVSASNIKLTFNLKTRLRHYWLVKLIAPGGDQTVLLNRQGMWDSGIVDLLLEDEAETAFDDALPENAPYSAAYSSLMPMKGAFWSTTTPNLHKGTWKLIVKNTDKTGAEPIRILSWRLDLRLVPTTVIPQLVIATADPREPGTIDFNTIEQRYFKFYTSEVTAPVPLIIPSKIINRTPHELLLTPTSFNRGEGFIGNPFYGAIGSIPLSDTPFLVDAQYGNYTYSTVINGYTPGFGSGAFGGAAGLSAGQDLEPVLRPVAGEVIVPNMKALSVRIGKDGRITEQVGHAISNRWYGGAYWWGIDDWPHRISNIINIQEIIRDENDPTIVLDTDYHTYVTTEATYNQQTGVEFSRFEGRNFSYTGSADYNYPFNYSAAGGGVVMGAASEVRQTYYDTGGNLFYINGTSSYPIFEWLTYYEGDEPLVYWMSPHDSQLAIGIKRTTSGEVITTPTDKKTYVTEYNQWQQWRQYVTTFPIPSSPANVTDRLDTEYTTNINGPEIAPLDKTYGEYFSKNTYTISDRNCTAHFGIGTVGDKPPYMSTFVELDSNVYGLGGSPFAPNPGVESITLDARAVAFKSVRASVQLQPESYTITKSPRTAADGRNFGTRIVLSTPEVVHRREYHREQEIVDLPIPPMRGIKAKLLGPPRNFWTINQSIGFGGRALIRWTGGSIPAGEQVVTYYNKGSIQNYRWISTTGPTVTPVNEDDPQPRTAFVAMGLCPLPDGGLPKPGAHYILCWKDRDVGGRPGRAYDFHAADGTVLFTVRDQPGFAETRGGIEAPFGGQQIQCTDRFAFLDLNQCHLLIHPDLPRELGGPYTSPNGSYVPPIGGGGGGAGSDGPVPSAEGYYFRWAVRLDDPTVQFPFAPTKTVGTFNFDIKYPIRKSEGLESATPIDALEELLTRLGL